MVAALITRLCGWLTMSVMLNYGGFMGSVVF